MISQPINDEVNARRVEAIRRHRGKPDVIRQLKARIRELTLADESSKAIGIDVGLSAGKACKWMHALGFRRMYVTAKERRRILAKRRSDKARETKAK